MTSEWRDSSRIRPLLYVVLTALGLTFFAVICLNTPPVARWVISYRSNSWVIAFLGVLLTWIIVRRRLVKGWLYRGIASVLVGLLLKGSSFLLLRNLNPTAEPSATDTIQAKAAHQEQVESPGTTGSITKSNFRGNFSTAKALPTCDGAAVIECDWATVGDNYEVWQVHSGTWADQGYNIQGVSTNPGPSGFSATTSAPFLIPAVGSPVSIAAAMPWADVDDTVSITDGTHQLKGRVVANTGSVLSVLNSGYLGGDSGTLAAGSRITVCALPGDACELIYGCDDFLSLAAPTEGAPTWSYIGTNGLSMSNWQNGHAGIVSFPSGNTNSCNELIANQGSESAGPAFTNVQKCLVRWVVFCDGLYSSTSFDGEWYAGIGNPDGHGAMHGGALLSFAPGFPSTGLLAGSYTGTSSYTETPTSFRIAPNTWYDLIISWTPTAIKYYAAVYGSTPKLIATNATNISKIAQYPIAGNNRYVRGANSVTLFIDRVEWLYQIPGNNSMVRHSIQPRNGCSCSLGPNKFSRICKTRNLQSPFDGLMSKVSLIIRTLCPSASLIPAVQSRDAAVSAGCSLCVRHPSAFNGAIPASGLVSECCLK